MPMKDHIAQLHKAQAGAAPVVVTPATEDLDPGALVPVPAAGATVVISPNPDNLRTLHETYDRLEQEADTNVQDELQDTQDGLTEIRDSIDDDNASGGLSAESACFAAMAIESYSNRLGIRSNELTGSLESAISEAGDGKVVVSTEALTATLEGVDNVGKDIFKRALSNHYRAYIPLWSMVKIYGMTLGGTVEKARRAKGRASGPIRVKAKWVNIAGKVSNDVVGDFLRTAEVLNYIIGEFGPEAKQAFNANLKAVNRLTEVRDSADLPKALADIWSHWRDPRAKLGADVSKPLIPDLKLFEDQSLKYHGTNADAKKFDAFANLAYPTVVMGQHRHRDKSDDKGWVEIPALTPEQIVKVGNLLKDAVKKFGAWKAFVERVAAESTNPFRGSFDLIALVIKLIRRSKGESAIHTRSLALGVDEVNTVKDALKTSNRMILHVPYDAGVALINAIAVFNRLAKLSLKAHAKAALESFGNINAIDGVTVNETSAVEPSQEPAKDATAPEGEVKPKQDGIQDLAVMHQDVNGPTEPKKAEAELTQIAKNQQSDLPVPKQEGGPGLESHSQPAPGLARPYWFKG